MSGPPPSRPKGRGSLPGGPRLVGVEPHRLPFDHTTRISGYNLFVSAYHGFATLGNEHVPSPRAFDAASNATVVIPDVASQSQYQVHARFVLLDTETGYRSQYLQQSFLIQL